MSKKTQAFTLAEVLITLGIIGVVAAITMPTVIAKVQDKVLMNQFKKAYSILSNMTQKVNADLDYTTECYEWINNPYNGQYNCDDSRNAADVCITDRENGKNGVVMNDPNTPVPSDIWGKYGDCYAFWTQAKKTLKVAKTCDSNGGNNKCYSSEYKGFDQIKVKNFGNLSQTQKDLFTGEDDYASQISAGCPGYRASNIGNQKAIVLQDGITIIGYGGTNFMVDINGLKGPNKWGYDLYTFKLSGNDGGGRKITQGNCMVIEDGGYTTDNRIKMIGKN